MIKLSFHGGAKVVTGACYLLKTDHTKILVDCGLFQGCQDCPNLNMQPFQFDPKEIEMLFVTHAHLDHVGRIPKLVRAGFRGTIVSTAPTRDLARLILEDALSLQERDISPALYEEKDIEAVFKQWRTVSYHEPIEIGDCKVLLRDAGHILGSSFIDITVQGKRLLFTGDLGNIPSSLLPPHEDVQGLEYLVIESAYGNRIHESNEERVSNLERAIEDVTARGGTLMIPAFATERTQDILFITNELLLTKRIPEIPVFVDSPLAIRVTEVFERYPAYYNKEIQELFKKHPNIFKFKKLLFTERVEDSKKINDVHGPKVVIAGSGMLNGGRILHHARRYLSDSKSILLIIGYQAEGTLGRKLVEGTPSVKLFGEEITVRAEIRQIKGFSAHADNPQLYQFVFENRETLKHVFVVQGEEASATHLMQEVRDRMGVYADTPGLGDEFEI